MQKTKVVIIGSGPAAYTAAIYCSRAMLQPLLFEGFEAGTPGGQLMTTTDVENFPGFPEGISGPDLMQKMREQAEKFGTHIVGEDVVAIDCSNRPFIVKGSTTEVAAQSIIIATGAKARLLDIPGTHEGEFWQKGVSACALCDGAMPIFRNKDIYIIGGGDTAMEEALFLTRYASHVYIVHRRDELRASKIMGDRAQQHPKITILWSSGIVEVKGDKVVTSVVVKNLKTEELSERPAAGLFFAVGYEPNTQFLPKEIEIDDKRYVALHPGSQETTVKGIFAAGDVHDHVYRQAVTAAGAGCRAALELERELSAL